LNEEHPVRRKFWWMKERPRAEIIHTEVASNRTSISEASGDSPQMEGGSATIPPTIRNVNVAEIPAIASPDISSSMAEFLEKEKLCKVVTSDESVNSLQKKCDCTYHPYVKYLLSLTYKCSHVVNSSFIQYNIYKNCLGVHCLCCKFFHL